MTSEAEHRATVLMELEAGRIPLEAALETLGCSRRHLNRLRAKVLAEGPAGLNHGNLGRVPWHALGDQLRHRVVELYRQKRYFGMNFHQFTEMIAEHEGIVVSRSVVHRWLRAEGISPPRPQRRRRHRRRRTRSTSQGHMLQWDASVHRWVPHLPKFAILAAVDDATGKLWVSVRPTEDLQGYMELMEQIFTSVGIPRIAYTDGFSSFGQKGHRDRTYDAQKRETAQLKRALRQLGVQHITAGSAPAKGRVERIFDTLQDRLVSHLRFDQVADMEDVFRSIVGYVRNHNLRFTKSPHNPQPAWREWPKHLTPGEIFCRQEARVVRKDSTITFYGTVIDLPPNKDGSSRYRQRVDVLTSFTGAITVKHGPERMAIVLPPQKAPNPGLSAELSGIRSDRLSEPLRDRI